MKRSCLVAVVATCVSPAASASMLKGVFEPFSFDFASNLRLNNAGVIGAASYVGAMRRRRNCT